MEAGNVVGLWSKGLLQVLPQGIANDSVAILFMLATFFLHNVNWLLALQILGIPLCTFANELPDKLG